MKLLSPQPSTPAEQSGWYAIWIEAALEDYNSTKHHASYKGKKGGAITSCVRHWPLAADNWSSSIEAKKSMPEDAPSTSPTIIARLSDEYQWQQQQDDPSSSSSSLTSFHRHWRFTRHIALQGVSRFERQTAMGYEIDQTNFQTGRYIDMSAASKFATEWCLVRKAFVVMLVVVVVVMIHELKQNNLFTTLELTVMEALACFFSPRIQHTLEYCFWCGRPDVRSVRWSKQIFVDCNDNDKLIVKQ